MSNKSVKSMISGKRSLAELVKENDDVGSSEQEEHCQKKHKDDEQKNDKSAADNSTNDIAVKNESTKEKNDDDTFDVCRKLDNILLTVDLSW